MALPLSRDGTARFKPEDLHEVHCHDMLLPLDMTLAAVRRASSRFITGSESLFLCRRRLIEADITRGGMLSGKTLLPLVYCRMLCSRINCM
jgi:hypothetical protein